MRNLLRRPAAIALAMAAGVGVACVYGFSQTWAQTDDGDFAVAAIEGPATSRANPTPRAPAAVPPSGRPLRMEIPALSVTARVLPTGVTGNGEAEIPSDGDDVGWYEFGVSPGAATGSAVLIGHRDTEAEGPGALFSLDELRPGDRLLVSNRDQTLIYRTTARTSFNKQALPSALFSRTGQHRLTLITCGGAFLPDVGGYQENLVVTAELVRTAGRARTAGQANS